MPTRTIYLTKSRTSRSQRAHFAIFVPSPSNPSKGTLINAVGAPMAGYMLEFKRNDYPATTQQGHCEFFPIGEVDSRHIVDDAADENHEIASTDSEPRGELEMAAKRVRTPGVSENFMAPVNDVSYIYLLSIYLPWLVASNLVLIWLVGYE